MFKIALIVFIISVLLNMGTDSESGEGGNPFAAIGAIAFLVMIVTLFAGC